MIQLKFNFSCFFFSLSFSRMQRSLIILLDINMYIYVFFFSFFHFRSFLIHTYSMLENSEEPSHMSLASSVAEVSYHQEDWLGCYSKLLANNKDQIMFNQLECPTMMQGSIEKVTVDYWNISDDELKERLIMIPSTNHRLQTNIQQWLETDVTLFQFIRQHASLIADFHSLNMELALCETYINMTQYEFAWLSRMSKPMITSKKISPKFFKTQIYIKKQLKSFKRQSKAVTEKLATFLCQHQEVSSLSINDVNQLKGIITIFVQENQQQLYADIEKKKYLLMLNAYDVRLTKEFFDLNPSSQQVSVLFHPYIEHSSFS